MSCLYNEIVEAVSLCDEGGRVNRDSIGYARFPLHICNLSGKWYRRKKWNYWSVSDNKYYLTAAILDLGYTRSAFVYLLDIEKNTLCEMTDSTISPKSCTMSETVYGECVFNSKKLRLEFFKKDNVVNINIRCDNIEGLKLKAQLYVDIFSEQETLNVVIPWDSKRYHFTSKQNCLPARGKIQLDNNTIELCSNHAWASLDYGRGIWPYKTYWNWASCSIIRSDKRIGFNLGGGWTDNTGMNENAFFIDKHMHKIKEDVVFAYDKADKLKQWSIKTNEGSRLNLSFEPIYQRLMNNKLLFVKSELYQIFGYFSGYYITDDKETIEISKAFGCVEEHNAKW